MEAYKLQHILMYFINTSLTVSVQRVLFSVLFSSDCFGSGIYLFHMAKEEGKREHKLLEKRLKNPLLKQHEKPLILLIVLQETDVTGDFPPEGRRQEEFWESKLDGKQVVSESIDRLHNKNRKLMNETEPCFLWIVLKEYVLRASFNCLCDF